MDYSKLCETYSKLEATNKGLEKAKILSEFLGLLKDNNNPDFIYLLQGKVFPDYDNRELGISLQLAVRAISKVSGNNDSIVVNEFKRLGGLGKVSEFLIKEKKQQTSLFSKKLSINKVFNNLRKITAFEGKGAVENKINLIVELLHSASPIEAKYIIRSVLGDLKIGVGNGILRDAIVEFCFKPKDMNEKKKGSELIQDAYDKVTDFKLVFKKACENKLDELNLNVGKPVRVMLYPKAKGAEDAFRIVGKPAAFEYKYDGFRMMINKDNKGNIKIFTRRLEEVSNQFPDAVKFIKENVKGKNFIIDCEAIGYNPRNKTYTEFQAISQRIRRKHDIERLVKELPIELRLFDVIFYEDKSLIDKSYEKRRELLEKIVTEKKWEVMLAERIITDNIKVAEDFFEKSLNDGQEGLMVKGLDKKYKPGARIGYGVKWKPKDNDLDLVIVGAEWGTGKRAGWLTSFDVACKDEDELKEIGKVSTGLKEKPSEGFSFEELTKMLKEIQTEEIGRKIKVKPEIIVSVQYQNIQKSPTYSSGYALRFPRIIRMRPDRSVSDVATIDEIEKEI